MIDTHDDEPRDELSGRIIGAALEVMNVLGAGFLEKVYRLALGRDAESSFRTLTGI